MTLSPNPFFDLGYPVDSMAHPFLPWWRQNIVHRQQGTKLLAATFTFERWDGVSAGPKTWEWKYDETEADLLARRRDVLATLLALDTATPLSPPAPRVGLCGVRFNVTKGGEWFPVSDRQITAIERTTDPLGYQFYPPHGQIDGVPTWGHTWPLPDFVIVDEDTPWCPPQLAPYPWIDPDLLLPNPAAADTPAVGAPELPDLPDVDDDTDATLVHVDDDGEPLCGATTGMMIDVRLGAPAMAQMDCPDCKTLVRVELNPG